MPEETTAAATSATPATTTTPDNSSASTTTTAPTLVPSSTPKPGFVGEDGKFQDGWLDRLPPEFAPSIPTLAKYRDIQSLAKAHGELQQLLGKKSEAINIPKEGSSPEEIAVFRKALGVPEKVEDYKLIPDKLPDGFVPNKELAAGAAAIAHRHNIPAKAMEELGAFYTASEEARSQVSAEMAMAELEQGKAKLKESWGANFEKNIERAARAARTVGLDPESPGLRDPEVIKALNRFAEMMAEDKLVSGDFSPSMQNGQYRAKDIMTNPKNPLYEKYQQGEKETVELVRSLMQHG